MWYSNSNVQSGNSKEILLAIANNINFKKIFKTRCNDCFYTFIVAILDTIIIDILINTDILIFCFCSVQVILPDLLVGNYVCEICSFSGEGWELSKHRKVRGGSAWLLDSSFTWKPIPLDRDVVLSPVRGWEGALTLPGPCHVGGTIFTGWKLREFEADIESRQWSIQERDYQARFLILVSMLGPDLTLGIPNPIIWMAIFIAKLSKHRRTLKGLLQGSRGWDPGGWSDFHSELFTQGMCESIRSIWSIR